MGQDELANTVVEGEAVDGSAAHCDDELSRGTVHGETSGKQLGTGLQDILLDTLGAFGKLVNGENGANRHTGVQVRGSVNRIAGDSVVGIRSVFEIDDVVLLLRYEERTLARGAHGLNEEVIGDDIELLLVVAGDV